MRQVDVADDQRRSELANKIADAVGRHGLTTPAIWFLEMHKPLGFLGAQALLFLQPLLGVITGDELIQDAASLLEDPAGVDALLGRLTADKAVARKGR